MSSASGGRKSAVQTKFDPPVLPHMLVCAGDKALHGTSTEANFIQTALQTQEQLYKLGRSWIKNFLGR